MQSTVAFTGNQYIVANTTEDDFHAAADHALARAKGDWASRTDAEEQHKMFELRFETRLTEKKTRAQCEKFSATAPARADQMRDCHEREDRDVSAACVLQQ